MTHGGKEIEGIIGEIRPSSIKSPYIGIILDIYSAYNRKGKNESKKRKNSVNNNDKHKLYRFGWCVVYQRNSTRL